MPTLTQAFTTLQSTVDTGTTKLTTLNNTVGGSSNSLKASVNNLNSTIGTYTSVSYANRNSFPATGEGGKIYVATNTGYKYAWNGTSYVQVG